MNKAARALPQHPQQLEARPEGEVDRTVHMKDEAANFPDRTIAPRRRVQPRAAHRDRERKLIRKIDEALKRVETATATASRP